MPSAKTLFAALVAAFVACACARSGGERSSVPATHWLWTRQPTGCRSYVTSVGWPVVGREPEDYDYTIFTLKSGPAPHGGDHVFGDLDDLGLSDIENVTTGAMMTVAIEAHADGYAQALRQLANLGCHMPV